MTRLPISLLAALLVLAPGAAFAHVGAGDTSGFAHGFMHPVTGIDHVLAMVAVGVFAYQLGGRALWLVPGTFVLVMAAGGALGIAGIALPHVETGIALSVVVLGAIIGHWYEDRIGAPEKEGAPPRKPGGDRWQRLGVLVASGMIVGESLFGVFNSAIIYFTDNPAPLALVEEELAAAPWLGALAFVALIVTLYGWMLRRSRSVVA